MSAKASRVSHKSIAFSLPCPRFVEPLLLSWERTACPCWPPASTLLYCLSTVRLFACFQVSPITIDWFFLRIAGLSDGRVYVACYASMRTVCFQVICQRATRIGAVEERGYNWFIVQLLYSWRFGRIFWQW